MFPQLAILDHDHELRENLGRRREEAHINHAKARAQFPDQKKDQWRSEIKKPLHRILAQAESAGLFHAALPSSKARARCTSSRKWPQIE